MNKVSNPKIEVPTTTEMNDLKSWIYETSIDGIQLNN